jgi:rare lipoprotein A
MRKMLLSKLFLIAATMGVISTVAATASAQQAIRGLATWYGNEYLGSRTANGEMFNPNGLTAAHRTLPFGTQVRVTNEKTGKSVVVRINDRLGDPAIAIDLSMGAAKVIQLTETAPVKLEILSRN